LKLQSGLQTGQCRGVAGTAGRHLLAAVAHGPSPSDNLFYPERARTRVAPMREDDPVSIKTHLKVQGFAAAIVPRLRRRPLDNRLF